MSYTRFVLCTLALLAVPLLYVFGPGFLTGNRESGQLVASPIPTVAVSTANAAPIGKTEWPVFRGNALMTGAGQAKLPDQLEEKWTFKCKDEVEGAPAIVDGTVYVASFDKFVYAIDLANGKEKW